MCYYISIKHPAKQNNMFSYLVPYLLARFATDYEDHGIEQRSYENPKQVFAYIHYNTTAEIGVCQPLTRRGLPNTPKLYMNMTYDCILCTPGIF